MITANVKQICCCDLERIGNERLTHHGRLRRGHRRLEQSLIANSSRAAMSGEHFTMNRFDCPRRQMLERLAQDKRLKSAVFFLIKRLAVFAAVSESITGSIGVRTIEPPG